MAELTDIRETVRERYAAAANAVSEQQGGCCSAEAGCARRRGPFPRSASPANRALARANRRGCAPPRRNPDAR